jgi:CDP-4-dehydro-6-deoxyglucose reductase
MTNLQKPKILKATVTKKEKLVANVYEVGFQLEEKICFLAGQYLNLKVSPSIRRSYSISIPADACDYVETIVDTTPGGYGSQYFEKLKVGDETELIAPLGRFIVHEDIVSVAPADEKGDETNDEKVQVKDTDPIIFLATGTGFTPFKSMFERLLVQLKSSRPIYFYWGLRSQESIYCYQFLDRLCRDYPNFDYKICLSQPQKGWVGDKGYVQKHLKKDWRGITNIDSAQFYLCGAGMMIIEATEMLTKKGISKERIFFEKYYQ